MRRALSALILSGLALQALPALAEGGLPLLVPVQGRLLDGADVPLNETIKVTFSVYRVFADSPGNHTDPVWSASWNLKVSRGVFGVTLGDSSDLAAGGTPLTTAVFAVGQEAWLGVAIAEGAELSPRLRVASVPFALAAQRALDSDLVGGESTALLHDASKLTGVAPLAALGPAIAEAKDYADTGFAIETAARLLGDTESRALATAALEVEAAARVAALTEAQTFATGVGTTTLASAKAHADGVGTSTLAAVATSYLAKTDSLDAARLSGQTLNNLDARYLRTQTGVTSVQTSDLAITGAVKAASFSGDGSVLTGIDATKLGGMTWGANGNPLLDAKAYIDAGFCRARAGVWDNASGCAELVKLVKALPGEGPAESGAWWDPAKVTTCSARTDGYNRYCGMDELVGWWPQAYGAGTATIPDDWVMVLGSGPRLALSGGNSENALTTGFPNAGWLCHPSADTGYRAAGAAGASTSPATMGCMGWSHGYAGRWVACCK